MRAVAQVVDRDDGRADYLVRQGPQVHFSGWASVHADQSSSHAVAAAAEPPDRGSPEGERGCRSGDVRLHGSASAPPETAIRVRPSAVQGNRRMGFLDTRAGDRECWAVAAVAAVAGRAARTAPPGVAARITARCGRAPGRIAAVASAAAGNNQGGNNQGGKQQSYVAFHRQSFRGRGTSVSVGYPRVVPASGICSGWSTRVPG